MNSTLRYDRVQVVLHWLIAVMILAMIGLGLYMVELPKQSELLPGEESMRVFYFSLHKSLGITAAILIVLRVIWRLTHQVPPLPDTVSKWQQKAAGIVHTLLYVVMVGVPLSGYLQSMFSEYHTKFWGITLPRMVDADKVMRENFSYVHELLAFLLIALIVIHLVATVKHHLAKTGVSDRMSFKR